MAEFDDREIDLRKRQGQANDDGRAAGAVITLRAINQFAVERGAATHGMARSAGKGLLNFGAIGVVFHCLGVGFGIGEDAAGTVDHGDARAAAGCPAGPGAKFGGVIGLRRIGESEI